MTVFWAIGYLISTNLADIWHTHLSISNLLICSDNINYFNLKHGKLEAVSRSLTRSMKQPNRDFNDACLVVEHLALTLLKKSAPDDRKKLERGGSFLISREMAQLPQIFPNEKWKTSFLTNVPKAKLRKSTFFNKY